MPSNVLVSPVLDITDKLRICYFSFYLQQVTARDENNKFKISHVYLCHRPISHTARRHGAKTSLVKFVGASLACGGRWSVPATLRLHAVLGHGMQDSGKAPVPAGTDDEFGGTLVGSVIDDRLSGLLTAMTTGRHVVGRPTIRVSALVAADDARQLRRLAATDGASSACTRQRESRREQRVGTADTAWHMLKKQ